MSPIVQLYLIRTTLGILAGGISAALAQFIFVEATDFVPLINCITVAIAVYLVTFYVLKAVYRNKVEQQSKILSTGIGMYFFVWIASLVLIYTALQIYLV
ncbi:MAG: hypothetical protein LBQ98_07310 [Nitrososphaerota archaeon]|jgi:hypothetical protein|nr:hypothetical protein [Nitrososphaerota archaeon]